MDILIDYCRGDASSVRLKDNFGSWRLQRLVDLGGRKAAHFLVRVQNFLNDRQEPSHVLFERLVPDPECLELGQSH